MNKAKKRTLFVTTLILGFLLAGTGIFLIDQFVIGHLPALGENFGSPHVSNPSRITFSHIQITPPNPGQELSEQEFSKLLIPLGPVVDRFVYDSQTEARLEERNWMYQDPDLGRTEKPSSDTRHQLFQGHQFVFNVTYHSDNFGRRITPYKGDTGKEKKFIALFGCSMTYGHGVQANETLPYYLGQNLKGYMPYNYAVGGTGTSFSLALLQKRDLTKEITQGSGIGLYMYIDDHLGRTIGDSVWSTSALGTPNYFIDSNGEVKRSGTFESAHPVRSYFYKIFYKSNFSKKLKLRLPPYISDKHIELVCGIMTQMKKEFLKQFPTSQFYIGFLPEATRDFDRISACLTRQNVEFLDLRNAKQGYDSVPFNFPYDGHPTPQGNQATAHAVIELLERKQPR